MTETPSILLIGYGNPLRGDDVVGQVVAGIVEAWDVPNVRVLARHQLTPELADGLAQCDIVYFVDASIDATLGHPLTRDVELSTESEIHSHYSSPKELLTLTRQLYGREPRAYLIEIPTDSFDLHEGLSAKARRGVEETLDNLRQTLGKSQRPVLSY